MSWSDFLAGCLGGSVGVLVGHPLDTLKVKQQTCNMHTVFASIQNTYRQNQIRGFYKGMAFPLVSSGIVNCLFFGVYGHACQLFGQLDYARTFKVHEPNYSIIYIAGCCGGIAQLSIMVPIDVVKVRLQVHSHGVGSYKGPRDCVRRLWFDGGIRSCYKGLWIQAFRDVPSFGVYMVVYEWLLFHWPKSEDAKRRMVAAAIAGGCAGSITWGLVIPLDVIKSRIQADCLIAPKYGGFTDCLRKSFSEEGFRTFYKGLGLCVTRAFPVNAVTFVVYSWSLSFFGSFSYNI